MSAEHEFNARNKKLETPVSLYVGPEMLAALEQTSRGEPLTWGATPLEPHRPDLLAQQREVRTSIQSLFPKTPKQVPFGLDWDTAQFIENDFIMRNAQRVDRNYVSYQYRGVFDLSKVPLHALGFVDRSLSGHASPAEIMATTNILQIPAAELASISVPYGGERLKKYQQPMRAAVKEAVLFFDGEILDSDPVYEVRHANYHDPSYRGTEPVLTMTRIIDVGRIGDEVTVIERASFDAILSRLTPDLVEEIVKIPYDKNWSKNILAVPGYEAAVADAMKDDRHDLVVPISITAAAKNSRLIETLIKNKEHRQSRTLLMTRKALEESGKPTLL